MTDRVGQQLGNYRLPRVLGQGTFATVYLGEHQYLERFAAIKVLHIRMELRTHEAFRREARTIAQLRHPHIIGVHDFGFEDQTPYLVMEYMPNGNLRSRYPKGTRLPIEQGVTYAKQIASALDYAHERHVIHRDVKPENLLLGSNHEIVLSDFGIAMLQHTLDTLPIEHSAGTPLYMAPEQIQHKPCPASDQYALGVMVYEWLCGEPPFNGSLYEVLGQHLHKPPPSLCARLPQLPPAAEVAIFKALAKDPEQRFARTTDFVTALSDAFFPVQTFSLSRPLEPGEQDHTVLPSTRLTGLPVLSPSQQQQDLVSTDSPVPSPSQQQQDLASTGSSRPLNQEQVDYGRQGQVDYGRQGQAQPLQHPARSSQAHMNRQRLLQRVRLFWITGVLERSLHGAALMALGLQEQPDAVVNPWRLVIQESEGTSIPLPAGTRITEVYDEVHGELLILGEPGSGKTTLLLELARDLLSRAEQELASPMPVVFNLSSWVRKRQPLATWLIEELEEKYQVPRKVGTDWINTDQILPLLDGLDEVDAPYRTTCMQAINAYHQAHSLVPLVVCCRINEYMSQANRLALHRAVTIQPLTPEQVNEYFARIGEQIASLRVAFQNDPVLQELATTPLMVTILVMVYQGSSLEEIAGGLSVEVRQQQIFAIYTQRMLQRRTSHPHFSKQRTIEWLSWLARQMKQHSQTQFSLERLQVDWLPNRRPYQLYTSLAIGLLSFLIMIPVNGILFWNLLPGTLVALLDAVIAILFVWLSVRDIHGDTPLFSMNKLQLTDRGNEENTTSLTNSPEVDNYNKKTSNASRGFVPRLATFFVRILRERVAFASLSGLLDGMLVQFLIGPVYSAVHGLFYATFYVVLGKLEQDIQPAEILLWSWRSVWHNAVKSWLQGVGVGFLLGLFNAIPYVYHPSTFFTTLAFGLSVGCAIGLVIMLMRGFSSNMLDTQKTIKPNQGIRNSLSNSTRLGLFSGLAFGFIIFLYYSLVIRSVLRVGYIEQIPLNSGLIYGVSDGLAVAYLYWLKNGGFACVQHLILRVLLWQNKCIPWRYPRFLDYAHERIILRKVGGGYIFIHKLLLEYFANLDIDAQIRRHPSSG
jgi:serine/threonine protein kinase/DNA polymerase III delta prime subunit